MALALTNREIATLILLTVFALWVICYKPVRGSLRSLAKSAFSRIILIATSLAWLWVGTGVFILCKIGYWNNGMMKETVLWAAFSGLLISFQGVNAADPANKYRKILRQQFTWAVFVTFYANLQSFPLFIEIPFQLIVTFFALMQIVAQGDEKHQAVEKLCGCILSLIGLSVMSWMTIHVIQNHSLLFNAQNLKSLTFPFVMMLWVIPFGYLFSVYANYERLLTRLNLNRHQPRDLRFYTTFKLLSGGGIRAARIKRMDSLLSGKPAWTENHEQIDDLFAKLNEALEDPDNKESRDFIWPERDLLPGESRYETLEEYFDILVPCYEGLLTLSDISRDALAKEADQMPFSKKLGKRLSTRWEEIDRIYQETSDFNRPPREAERLDTAFHSFACMLHNLYMLYSPLNTQITESHRKDYLTRSYQRDADLELQRLHAAYGKLKDRYDSIPSISGA